MRLFLPIVAALIMCGCIADTDEEGGEDVVTVEHDVKQGKTGSVAGGDPEGDKGDEATTSRVKDFVQQVGEPDPTPWEPPPEGGENGGENNND